MAECKFRTEDGMCDKCGSRSACILPKTEWFIEDVDTFEFDEVCQHSSIFGNTYSLITKEDLDSLQNGKVLYIDDGEYGHFIMLKGD